MKVRNPEQISIPASNTTKDPGLTNSQIIRMVNLVKKTENMNIFEELWETLRNLFRSDKHSQTAARQILKDAFYFQNCDDYSKYFTGAVDGKARDRFTHRLKKFNELKEHAKDPEMMQARGSISSENTLCVSFYIGNIEIYTQKLQLGISPTTGGIDLSHAYLSGISLNGACLRKADLSNAEMDKISLCSSNLLGADLHGAKMNNAKVISSDLSDTNLSDIDMSDTDLDDTLLRNAKMDNTILNNAYMENTNVRGINLSKADLSGQDSAKLRSRGAIID
ncbi:pentapeptide repeat-containing protein [Escherichia coli]|uniref:Pentapeptide repeat-containing protein n=3 Tax=Escherichia coli TaxID=562 RepID=A0A8S7CSJ1_ECOLX|nr:pentapeptide repeat-containing protein [Escherichia coli O156]EFA4029764.1 pentapeptide repeat-containing protein [Escherichia coli O108:H9]EFB2194408.1 pentapeptide repeat-containing protein [Escherichia coli]EFB2357057.1 pentapeptide repeat-containing protein [Escherichia coli]EFC6680429.1 pentapeptide repeat-containing protein [Escherichia coli]